MTPFVLLTMRIALRYTSETESINWARSAAFVGRSTHEMKIPALHLHDEARVHCKGAGDTAGAMHATPPALSHDQRIVADGKHEHLECVKNTTKVYSYSMHASASLPKLTWH